jgi:L-ascorbate metabolism protein UlaG (beta-lactamase superfamily)
MADGAAIARRAGTSADRIVFLGHSSVLIELEGVRLLTDPLLRGRVAHLRRRAPPVDRTVIARPDAVLISHLHHDHLDLASLRLLGRDVPLLVPAGAGAWLGRRRFTAVTELSVDEVATVGPLAVGAVEACHDGWRLGGPRAETLGYVVRGAKAIYFAGDTELFAGMSNLHRQLDVALVPVSGWGSTLGPGHMDPLQAARAVSLLQPRLAIPIHWGTLRPIGPNRRDAPWLHDPAGQFAGHVARMAPDVEVRILAPGQETAL